MYWIFHLKFSSAAISERGITSQDLDLAVVILSIRDQSIFRLQLNPIFMILLSRSSVRVPLGISGEGQYPRQDGEPHSIHHLLLPRLQAGADSEVISSLSQPDKFNGKLWSHPYCIPDTDEQMSVTGL